MLFDIAAAADALEDLLDHERRLILEGRIADVARSTRQKEHLMARIGKISDSDALIRIRRKADRNQALLMAAARGLKAARGRIDRIATGAEQMRTYGANGTPRNMPDSAGKPGINHRV